MEQSPMLNAPTIANAKHKAFADALLRLGSKRAAALEVGYAETSASSIGTQICAKPEVQAYLAHMQAQSSEEAKSARERILEELSNIAFSNIQDFTRVDADGNLQIDFSAATREQLSAVRSFKTKERRVFDRQGNHVETEKHAEFTLWDKLRAGELLGREHGLFKQEEQRIVIDVADRLLAARRRVVGAALPQLVDGSGGEE